MLKTLLQKIETFLEAVFSKNFDRMEDCMCFKYRCRMKEMRNYFLKKFGMKRYLERFLCLRICSKRANNKLNHVAFRLNLIFFCYVK